MQDVLVLKNVEVPEMPRFRAKQKVRVSDDIADAIVSRGFGKYDQGKPAKTDGAKKAKEEKEATKSKFEKSKSDK